MASHLRRESEVGAHWAAAEQLDNLERSRSRLAELIGTDSKNICFGPSAGRLWSLALSAMPLSPGSRILIAHSEWPGNWLNLLTIQKRTAISIELLPTKANTGLIDVDKLAEMIDDHTMAVCLPVVSNAFGERQPIEQISKLRKPENCLIFVDGAQAVGRYEMHLQKLGADILVAPGRKWLRGPRGEAVMALSNKALGVLGAPVLLDQFGSGWTETGELTLAADATRFETYEISVAGRLGFGEAAGIVQRYGCDNIDRAIWRRLQRIYTGLSSMRTVQIFERVEENPAFLTFATSAYDAATLNQTLAALGVAVAVVTQPSDSQTFGFHNLPRVTRIAPHAYTTEADVDRFLDILSSILTSA